MPDPNLPDFSSKHVLFYCSDQPDFSILLQDISFTVVSERLFVTGRVSDGVADDTWTRGLPVGIDWALVQRFMVFDGPEHYRERSALWKKKRRAAWPWQSGQ